MSVYEGLEFAPILLTDVFRLHGGMGREKSTTGTVPYVAASFQNNGVVGYVSEPKCPGGWLSFVKDGDGGAGTCFYQPLPFWPSNHVFGLEPISDKATEAALLMMAATITHPRRLEQFTKILMNPPYSQAKDKTTRHLSELSFIERALSQLEVRGRLAAIVPQSAMVGKTQEDKMLKAKIMKHHTLDAVLTMNSDTFHGVGTHVVIALFTAGVPHSELKKTTFVNFKDDGYKVRQHVGLVDNGSAVDRRRHLLGIIKDGVPDDTSVVVRSEVSPTDEWQHSYFYFNDQPPSEDDFYETVANYVTWQVYMNTHGRGDLNAPVTTAASRGDGDA